MYMSPRDVSTLRTLSGCAAIVYAMKWLREVPPGWLFPPTNELLLVLFLGFLAVKLRAQVPEGVAEHQQQKG